MEGQEYTDAEKRARFHTIFDSYAKAAAILVAICGWGFGILVVLENNIVVQSSTLMRLSERINDQEKVIGDIKTTMGSIDDKLTDLRIQVGGKK
jgi:uncharacterized coiled-coil protein SlyX